MIKELIEQGLSYEEIIARTMETLNIVRSEAEFIYAIETGEIKSDVINLDEDEE